MEQLLLALYEQLLQKQVLWEIVQLLLLNLLLHSCLLDCTVEQISPEWHIQGISQLAKDTSAYLFFRTFIFKFHNQLVNFLIACQNNIL